MPMTPQVREKLNATIRRYDELTALVSDPAVQADPTTYRTHAKALADMQELVDAAREYVRLEQELADTRDLAASGDAEMKALAAGEIAGLESTLGTLEDRIKVLLIPKDPNDDRNVV